MKIVILICSFFFTSISKANSFVEPTVIISDAVIRVMSQKSKSAAGYMTITNFGKSDETLIGVETTLGTAMLHTSIEDSSGITIMIHAKKIEIPSSNAIQFKPGSYHIMFLNLTKDFKIGDKIPVTLLFKNKSSIALDFNVTSLIQKSKSDETSRDFNHKH